jgi:alpha-L-fucosidase 2
MDLAAIMTHLRDAAEAARVLGKGEQAGRYQRILDELVPLPVMDGEWSIAPGLAMDVPVSHPYQIAPIYPGGLATSLGPDDLLPIAMKSIENIWRCSSRASIGEPGPDYLRWNDDLSMGWIGVARTWMGDGDGALDAVLNGWVTSTLKTNGFLALQGRAPEERRPMQWMQNQLCGLANVTNEMLLQSHSGVIQVFPALPSSWQDVTFIQLRAEGAILVSAERRNGRTHWVALTAEVGGTVRLTNPWDGMEDISLEVLHRNSGEVTALAAGADGLLALELGQAQSVLIVPAGDAPEISKIAPVDNAELPYSFTGPIAIRESDPQPDHTWTSWWGKPAKQ